MYTRNKLSLSYTLTHNINKLDIYTKITGNIYKQHTTKEFPLQLLLRVVNPQVISHVDEQIRFPSFQF